MRIPDTRPCLARQQSMSPAARAPASQRPGNLTLRHQDCNSRLTGTILEQQPTVTTLQPSLKGATLHQPPTLQSTCHPPRCMLLILPQTLAPGPRGNP
eukprot:76093-Rhodomonas_salina.1